MPTYANIISHANVGYTSKTVEERLSDSDYSRKAAGGLWKVIHTWDIPDQATESKVHRLLEESYALILGIFQTKRPKARFIACWKNLMRALRIQVTRKSSCLICQVSKLSALLARF
jgi:hypothetical protein